MEALELGVSVGTFLPPFCAKSRLRTQQWHRLLLVKCGISNFHFLSFPPSPLPLRRFLNPVCGGPSRFERRRQRVPVPLPQPPPSRDDGRHGHVAEAGRWRQTAPVCQPGPPRRWLLRVKKIKRVSFERTPPTLPSPEARVKLTPLMVDDSETIDAPPPAAEPTAISKELWTSLNMTYIELFKNRMVETLMSVESMERDGQDGGGIYQTPKSSSIAKLYVIVDKIFKQLQVDYEKENRVIENFFLDAGCGAHLPGLMFAVGGYKSIGLEIDRMRCALARPLSFKMCWRKPLSGLILHYLTRISNKKATGRVSRYSIFGT